MRAAAGTRTASGTRPSTAGARPTAGAPTAGTARRAVALTTLPSSPMASTTLGTPPSPPTDRCSSTQRSGAISVVRNGQVTTVGTPGDVVAAGEGGMLGIAVDPAFDANRRIYTCYMTAGDVRVVRWTVSTNWTLAEPGRPGHGDPPVERPPLRVPHEVRARRAAVDHDGRCRRRHEPSGSTFARRQGAAGHDGRQRRHPATRVVRSTGGSTPTASATPKASRSGQAMARPTSSSTVRGARTRSPPSPWEAMAGGTRSPGTTRASR